MNCDRRDFNDIRSVFLEIVMVEKNENGMFACFRECWWRNLSNGYWFRFMRFKRNFGVGKESFADFCFDE